MDLKALRKRCEARLEDLGLPSPFDVQGFCDVVAGRRGRPIVLRPTATRAGPWGLWVAGPSVDFIFYESETSPLHQEHIILHELGHLICGHKPSPVTEPVVAIDLLADLSPDTIRHMLSRTVYTAVEEQEAEVLASVLVERVSATQPRRLESDLGLPADDAEVLDRLRRTLQVDPEPRE